ncbi:phenolphthiocerol synthesis polyketide synthase type I Pks15/1 [Elysia marginata]|uniref:Phenolphthiocerol synthesis polyketide synthase type I Pks15/1 n=1 Tax=Elysia marginata TaxID=1093978 RepID=A0AAV4EDI6_9GAST|nr:phenolphthiocerol synthesis polyketide synthase type I Pks15/1 [Elysia marginata]
MQKIVGKNYSGSATVKIFKISQELYGMRYTGYLGDGDSKSYKTEAEADPPVYHDVGIEKFECCGHVQKRMGKRLLDKISQTKGKVFQHSNKKVKGIGDAGKGAVKRIQGHYGGAIRKNVGNLDKMKAVIWAIWYHRNGDHEKCIAWGGLFRGRGPGTSSACGSTVEASRRE